MPKISNTALANTVTANDDFLITRNNVNSANSYRVKASTIATFVDSRGSANLGVVASGNVVLSINNGPIQQLTCNGTITIVSPNTDCKIELMIVNGEGANSVSFSGFQKELNGGVYANTQNNSYLVEVSRIKAISVYKLYELQ